MVVNSVAGAGNHSLLHQRIESARTFAGQTVTVSFWAKADASKPIAIDLEQYFGTGGSPSSPVSGIGATKVTIGTSWQKVTVTTTVPSIAGKTIGNDGNSFLGLFIWFDAGSNFNSRTDSLGQRSGTFDIAQVQVEAGPVATPFERRPIGTELALCQRYYEVGTCTAFYQAYSATPATFGIGVRFAVTKRGAPTVTSEAGISIELPDVTHFRYAKGNVPVGTWVTPSFTASAEL